jgi:CheY-like chemotaxis protein
MSCGGSTKTVLFLVLSWREVSSALRCLQPRGIKGKPVIQNATSSNDLNGLRVLVVEDEAAISLLLEDMLLDFGCEVIGPAARLAAALDAVNREKVDLAILDVNVAGEPIYPVADALVEKAIPFVFSTGYGSAGIKDAYRDRPVLQKPFAQHDLKQKLLAAWRDRATT